MTMDITTLSRKKFFHRVQRWCYPCLCIHTVAPIAVQKPVCRQGALQGYTPAFPTHTMENEACSRARRYPVFIRASRAQDDPATAPPHRVCVWEQSKPEAPAPITARLPTGLILPAQSGWNLQEHSGQLKICPTTASVTYHCFKRDARICKSFTE